VHSDWLLISYSLPPEPSRLRVAAWRRMRKLGAVHVNEGFWFLPQTPALRSVLDNIAADVRGQGGTAWVLASQASDFEGADLARLYNDARAVDYAELTRHYERFLAHIEGDTENGNFGFAAVEELEQDLEKRARLLREIQERDVLHSDSGPEAVAGLQRCREALERFTEEAFKQTGGA
jgi:hypothetical protein